MNFDQWWATLTIKEQTTIGRNNAKFVWQSAIEAIEVIAKAEIARISPLYSPTAENIIRAIRSTDQE